MKKKLIFSVCGCLLALGLVFTGCGDDGGGGGGGSITWADLKGTEWLKSGEATSPWIKFADENNAQWSTLTYNNGSYEYQNTIMSFSGGKITTSKGDEFFNVAISDGILTISNWVDTPMNGTYTKK